MLSFFQVIHLRIFYKYQAFQTDDTVRMGRIYEGFHLLPNQTSQEKKIFCPPHPLQILNDQYLQSEQEIALHIFLQIHN